MSLLPVSPECEESLALLDRRDLPDPRVKLAEMVWKEWMESRDPLAMFSSFQPILDLTRDLTTNSNPSYPRPCRI